MDRELEIYHKCFKIMNNLKVKYNFDVMLQNSADEMGISIQEFKRIIEKYELYYFNKDTQKYEIRQQFGY